MSNCAKHPLDGCVHCIKDERDDFRHQLEIVRNERDAAVLRFNEGLLKMTETLAGISKEPEVKVDLLPA